MRSPTLPLLAALLAGCVSADPPVELAEPPRDPVEGVGFSADTYIVEPPRPPGPQEPREGWCAFQPRTNPGLDPPPQSAIDLLESGLTIDPATVTCPDRSFETWPPFVRRHTNDYSARERWGGFNDCVPQIDLQGRYDGVFITHTPLVTANFALGRYGDHLLGLRPESGFTADPVIGSECPDPVAAVVRQAEWLDDNALSRPYRGVETWAWGYEFANLQGELESPWTSAYAQGVAGAAYLAAFCVSQDERWLRGAEKALLNMLVPMSEGGAATWESEDAVWFEEAATDTARSARSLNGHLGALAAVWGVAEWTGNDDIATLVQYGFNAPLRELEKYDAGFISLYTQWALDYPFIAPKHDYNSFHIQQLSWVHEATGDLRALDMALRFARYDDPGFEVVDLSPRQFGTEDFWENWVYAPQWATPAPGWVVAELDRPGLVDRITLWTPEPQNVPGGAALRPGSVDIDLSLDGVNWQTFTRPWPERCNDASIEIPPTEARWVKVWLHSPNREEQPLVGLRSFGIHRASGHPAAVSQWLLQGWVNRPGMAFGDEGYAYRRIGSQTYDLDGAFPTGFELLLSGWRGPDDPFPQYPLPTVTTADAPDGPWTPLAVEPRMIGPYLAWQVLGDPGFRYMHVDIDVALNPVGDGRILIRNL